MQGSIHEMRKCDAWAFPKEILIYVSFNKDEDGQSCCINLELGREGVVFDNIDLFIKHRETLVALREAARQAIAHFDANK